MLEDVLEELVGEVDATRPGASLTPAWPTPGAGRRRSGWGSGSAGLDAWTGRDRRDRLDRDRLDHHRLGCRRRRRRVLGLGLVARPSSAGPRGPAPRAPRSSSRSPPSSAFTIRIDRPNERAISGIFFVPNSIIAITATMSS